MTLKELCEKYNVSESSVRSNFKRTQNSIYKKYGVLIKKIGRGKTAAYQEENKLVSDKRALTMFDEKHEVMLNNESLNLINVDFLIFLGVIFTPMGVFRGTEIEFLNYIGIKNSNENLKVLETALQLLVERELIFCDKDDDIIVLYIRRKAEREMKLGIEMIEKCREIAEKNHKSREGWIKLLKVWLGIQICSENQPFTLKMLSDVTGLSKYQILECKKILEEENIFKTARAGNYLQCFGTNVTLNGFYN